MKVRMTTPARQQGMALVMGLIILLVMTLISVSAMRSTLMQERMAGSFQGQQSSFQAAEAALQKAKRDLGEGPLPEFGQGGFYLRGDASHGPPPDWEDPDAPITGKPVETYDEAVSDDVARDPQYAIVRLPGSCTQGAINASGSVDRNAFRVMTRGFGASENSQTVLESYYCR